MAALDAKLNASGRSLPLVSDAMGDVRSMVNAYVRLEQSIQPRYQLEIPRLQGMGRADIAALHGVLRNSKKHHPVWLACDDGKLAAKYTLSGEFHALNTLSSQPASSNGWHVDLAIPGRL
ncbi:MAG: hypothetical protein WCD66_04530 [Rhodanobacteraceae bacterium]